MERSGVAAMSLGIIEECLDLSIDYAKNQASLSNPHVFRYQNEPAWVVFDQGFVDQYGGYGFQAGGEVPEWIDRAAWHYGYLDATLNEAVARQHFALAELPRRLGELFERAAPRSVLDVGCGEGVLTHKWAQRLRDGRVVGIDLEDPAIQAEWEKRSAPNLDYRIMKADPTFPHVRIGGSERIPRERASS